MLDRQAVYNVCAKDDIVIISRFPISQGSTIFRSNMVILSFKATFLVSNRRKCFYSTKVIIGQWILVTKLLRYHQKRIVKKSNFLEG